MFAAMLHITEDERERKRDVYFLAFVFHRSYNRIGRDVAEEEIVQKAQRCPDVGRPGVSTLSRAPHLRAVEGNSSKRMLLRTRVNHARVHVKAEKGHFYSKFRNNNFMQFFFSALYFLSVCVRTTREFVQTGHMFIGNI
jgi:hypothetical protein